MAPVTTETPEKLAPRDIALTACLSLLAFIPGLNRGLYIDEYTTWSVAQLPLRDLIADRLAAGHLPPYFVMESLWIRFIGDSEWLLRLPSMLFCAAAVIYLAMFAAELFSRRIGLFAAAFLILNQLTLWTAQTARPYAPILFASALGAWAVLRWWRGSTLALPLLFISALIGLSTQVLHALPWLVFLVLMLARTLSGWKNAGSRERMRLAGGVLAWALPSAAGFAMAGAMGSEQENFRQFRIGFPAGRLLDGVAQTYLGDFTFILSNSLFKYLVLAVLLGHIVAAVLWFRKEPRGRAFPRGLLLTFWLVFPLVVLTIVAGAGGKSVLAHERYYVMVLPAYVLLAAVAADYLWARGRLRWLAFVHVPLLLLFSVGWIVQDGDGPRDFAVKIGTEHPAVGQVMPLRYEFRNAAVPLRSTEDMGDETEQIILDFAREHGTFWLVIYNNYDDPLDDYLKNLPEGMEELRREESGHMRGALIRFTP